ncbi:hypothetical protein VMUT_1485 [Vulcanisaeta moutnovskia 768-28]|uniref:CRISPR system endoribonuclease Csx1 CARF domain-containing protein n=1 Tax=Vulcanisaeta moutnovskia (strain 768-28) TaxID=985053 RepID=F0QTH7_VULM7|nr:CRISPR-associated DxTHG motif protein [Vulcanisaeta moutnovskia]ADY01690.1 hypothetical protein VMUT_1485 [Vulcanisaeta moutnovskia 768-28]
MISIWNKIEDVVNEGSDLHVFLDVTHGINFMPTLTYQVVKYVATLALVKGVSL